MTIMAIAIIITGTLATYQCITYKPKQDTTYNPNYKGHL